MANRDSQIAVEVLRGDNTGTLIRDSTVAIEVLRGDNTATLILDSMIAIEVLHDRVQGVVHGAAEPIWVGGAD